MTINRRRKARQKILDSLNEKAVLSNDKGKLMFNKSFKLSRKNKKHSGRYTPQVSEKRKFSEMIANAEEPKEEYDDWMEYRDGYRSDLDTAKLRKNQGSFWQDPEEIKEINNKIKKQLAIRKAKKEKAKHLNR